MKVAVVGATGMVGQKMLEILAERNFPVSELLPVASKKSKGKKIDFNGKSYEVKTLQEAVDAACDVALFSAGGEVSLEWAPRFAEKGTTVVDNSSAWRMDETKKLIVPEINAHVLTESDKIIANPNCSTIQLVMVLNMLHLRYGIKRVVVSTYQSVTGTGKEAVNQLEGEIHNENPKKVYPYPIFKNAIPHCDVFEENAYTKEEMKLTRETQKILNDPCIALTATAVRVPVEGGHCESVNVEFKQAFEVKDIQKILSECPGVTVKDNIETNTYPMPLYAKDKDEVFVGRIRRDYSQPQTLNMWIVADNLRKGAATNTIQIAEYLLKRNWIGNHA